MKTTIVLLLIITLFLLAAALLLKAKGRSQAGLYRQRKLMTENEAEFFGRLVVALPEHYIFPQVAMSALLDAASSDKKIAYADRLRIAQQRTDFVICSRQCEVVAVVELDDRSHSSAKDTLRDARLAQAGIKTFRFQSRSKPRIDELRATLLSVTAIPESVASGPESSYTTNAAH